MTQDHLTRVRTICVALPGVTERLSHGEPTFFVGKRVFTMFANNHHDDGRIAVWLPAPAGMQAMFLEADDQKFFKPPYVGVRGWVGIVLAHIDDAELAHHLETAWRLIAPKKLKAGIVTPVE